jgi:hypothetical protein
MRALLLVCLVVSAIVAVTPASADIVKCVGADGMVAFRDARDCPGARPPPAIKTETPRQLAPVSPETPRQLTPASRADSEDLARVENLRTQCDAAGKAAKSSKTPMGGFYAATLGIGYCRQYERAVKDRQRYEALRSQDPAAAAKELEAQRLAREERRRNRPVITNCTAWAADHVTCISQ